MRRLIWSAMVALALCAGPVWAEAARMRRCRWVSLRRAS